MVTITSHFLSGGCGATDLSAVFFWDSNAKYNLRYYLNIQIIQVKILTLLVLWFRNFQVKNAE